MSISDIWDLTVMYVLGSSKIRRRRAGRSCLSQPKKASSCLVSLLIGSLDCFDVQIRDHKKEVGLDGTDWDSSGFYFRLSSLLPFRPALPSA